MRPNHYIEHIATALRRAGPAALLALLALPLSAADTAFGSREHTGNALIGIIYDLKQTQKREKSGINPKSYIPLVEKFLDRNWDESILNEYFRAARPLYTTRIFIPMTGAKNAPIAFGVENVMKPASWVVHYKGQVSPPVDGTYRFLCYSDDMMVVAVNGEVVCEGSHGAHPYYSNWREDAKQRGPKIPTPGGGRGLIYGDWIELKKDEPVDLDILVGERPGGSFNAFLLYQRKGESYEMHNGVPLYPIFELSENPLTESFDRRKAPPFGQVDERWTAHQ